MTQCHSQWLQLKLLLKVTKYQIQMMKLFTLIYIMNIFLKLMRMYLLVGGNYNRVKNLKLYQKANKGKVKRLEELSNQFVNADKYVFVTPFWNFSFPPVMKAYLDSVSVAGKTFKYTAEGPVGLLPDKKALHIQARG